MIDTHDIPKASVLLDLDAPELALLGALEHLLAAACTAMEVANPELRRRDPEDTLEPRALGRIWSAEDVRSRAHSLAEAISRYRHALFLAAADDPQSANLPF